jgi:chromosome segregation ATPase
MNKIIPLVLLLAVTNLFAQQQQDSVLVKEIPTIKNKVFQQRQEINGLTKKLNSQNYIIRKQNQTISTIQNENTNLSSLIDSLTLLIQTNSQNITTNSKELGTKILEAGKKADTQIAELDSNVDKNRLYWIIVTLVTMLLGGLIYWLLSKRIKSNKTDVETEIRNTKASLEEESVKLDNKLVEVLETQLKLQQETAKTQPVVTSEKTDHSLALKVADEIIRIHKNLSRMDESTKGLKQLNSSVQRIQDNFAANGYELVKMLGNDYNEGLKATVNFIQDEDYEVGKRIITRIIKPQVNYKGTMIQTAQIEVTEA